MRLAKSLTNQELHALLLQFDPCSLECDGMTFVLSAFLEKLGMPHRKMIGSARLADGERGVSPHCWILLDDGAVVDFRLRMWLGQDPEIPHGVFVPSEANVIYAGRAREREVPMPTALLDILSEGRYSAALDKLKLAEES